MDMFEKAVKVTKEVGDSVISSVKNIGGTLYNTTKEQSELASLNVQKSVIEKKLMESYAEIGKRYVEYVGNCDGTQAFDVADVLESIRPELDRLTDVKIQINEKELAIRAANEERAQRKAQSEYDTEKQKLDKAMAMDIITQDEYDAKLCAAQKKLDNYDLLRKIDMQLQMGIISAEEHAEKIHNILK